MTRDCKDPLRKCVCVCVRERKKERLRKDVFDRVKIKLYKRVRE